MSGYDRAIGRQIIDVAIAVLVPEVSSIRAFHENGAPPPTALNEREGLFTPPTISAALLDIEFLNGFLMLSLSLTSFLHEAGQAAKMT